MHEITLILQQIADNTDTDNAVWVAAVSGGAAVLGATVSALISYFVTKRSIEAQEKLEDKTLRASIITNERLRWLQDIRGRISDLYVNLDMQYNFIQRPLGNLNQQRIQNLFDEYSTQVMSSVNMITLMLNNKDQPQIDLRNELQNVLHFMQSCFIQKTSSAQTFNNQQYAQMKNTIFNLATEIGSETWQQISNLERANKVGQWSQLRFAFLLDRFALFAIKCATSLTCWPRRYTARHEYLLSSAVVEN